MFLKNSSYKWLKNKEDFADRSKILYFDKIKRGLILFLKFYQKYEKKLQYDIFTFINNKKTFFPQFANYRTKWKIKNKKFVEKSY